MTPAQAVLNRIGPALAADTITITPAEPNEICLAINEFTPAAGITTASLTPATFDGYSPLGSAGTESGLDALSGNIVVQYTEPEGGWRWQVSGSTVLTNVAYGYYVTNAAGTVVVGCERFDTPIALNAVGKIIELPAVRITIPQATIF